MSHAGVIRYTASVASASSVSMGAYVQIRAQIYLFFGREAPCTLTYLGTWSVCYPAMSVIMVTMNTDTWTMNTDHVDHEHWHMGHEHWYVSVHGDSCQYNRYIYALVQVSLPWTLTCHAGVISVSSVSVHGALCPIEKPMMCDCSETKGPYDCGRLTYSSFKQIVPYGRCKSIFINSYENKGSEISLFLLFSLHE